MSASPKTAKAAAAAAAAAQPAQAKTAKTGEGGKPVPPVKEDAFEIDEVGSSAPRFFLCLIARPCCV